MLYLHRYKIIFLNVFLSSVFLLLAVLPAEAQRRRKNDQILGKNLANYDERKMHYGFYLGAVSTRMQVEHSAEYVARLQGQLDSAMTANPKPTTGFTLGFVLSRHLGDYFDLRFLPGVGFYNRIVEFESGGEINEQEVAATSVQLPFMLKYSSKRRKNSRMYLVAGATPVIDVGGSKRNERIDNKLRLDKNNLLIEYGVGLDLFYPLFKFAPELRVAHGIPNLLIFDNNAFSRSFQSVRTTSVTLYLFFE
ncbi:MAG TPA: porin family protein [Adhaeribacter sp.]|nr:porin family protein [Adhaeribacter sp.]